MQISVNGEKREVNDSCTVEDLLNQMEIPRKGLAVERNREIVPRTEYSTTILNNDDVLEIVSLVGGG
jgi:sulfur carrier protein